MGPATEKPTLSAADFLAWEAQQPEKHELFQGEAFAMVGARRVRVTVSLNVASLLKAHLRGTACRANMADMKLRAAENIFYPDVMVTCHPEDRLAETVMSQPKAIVEVLSDSTAGFDRGGKFAAYRQIDSLEEYALIDPERLSIEVFRRTPNGDWLLAASEAGRGLLLKSLDFAAPPEAVFEDVAAE